jgi:hypothetical protein
MICCIQIASLFFRIDLESKTVLQEAIYYSRQTDQVTYQIPAIVNIVFSAHDYQ